MLTLDPPRNETRDHPPHGRPDPIAIPVRAIASPSPKTLSPETRATLRRLLLDPDADPHDIAQDLEIPITTILDFFESDETRTHHAPPDIRRARGRSHAPRHPGTSANTPMHAHFQIRAFARSASKYTETMSSASHTETKTQSSPQIAVEDKPARNGSHADKRVADLAAELETLQAQRTEAQQIIAQMRKASAISAVVKGASQFKKDAARDAASAAIWLLVSILLALATIAVIAGFIAAYAEGPLANLRLIDEASTLAWSIQVGIGKVLLVLFLAYLTHSAIRNYRAARHNAILNRHRVSALELFESFANSAADSDVKSAVVLAAAQTTFAVQPTAFDRPMRQR